MQTVDELLGLCDDLEARQQYRHRAAYRFRRSALHSLTRAQSHDDLREAWKRVSTNWPTLTDDSESPADLRRVGLQLCVQGRMAKRNEHDQLADQLLERARADRDELVHRGLTRLVADNPSYVRADPLPAGWSWAPLQDVVRFIDYRGRTPTKTSSGIPLITAKNIRRGFISETPREYIAEQDFSRWMTRGLPRVGDVLFTTEAPMGNAAMIRTDSQFALAQRTITLAPYAELSGAFLELLLLSPWFADELAKRATGMTATGIKAAKLRLIRIPIPPMEEQGRMVDATNRFLGLCQELERRLAHRTSVGVSVSTVLASAS